MKTFIRRAFSHLPLRVVITAVVIALLTVTALVTWFLTFRNGRASIHELADQLGREGMENIRQHLERYTAAPVLVNEINSFAFFHDPYLGTPAAVPRMGDRFLEEIAKFDTITSVGYSDEQNESIAVGRQILGVPLVLGVSGKATQFHQEAYELDQTGQRLKRFYRSSLPYDPRLRPWYQVARAVREEAWSPVYLMTTGDPAIDAVLPVYFPDGRLRGVFDTTLTLAGIDRFLETIHVTAHSRAFIIDRQGMLMASSTAATPAAPSGDRAEPSPGSKADDAMVRAGSRVIMSHLAAGDTMEAERQFSLRMNGTRHVMHVAPFRSGPGIDWLIAEVIPETDFAEHIYDDMRTTAIFVAFLLLFSGYAALLLARRVTSPLEVLSRMARALAAGDLSQTIRLEGTDEIGNLASSFNTMAGELRRSFVSLAESESRYRAFVSDSSSGIFRFETRAPMPLGISEEDQMDWFYRHFLLAECNEAAVWMLGHRRERDILGMDPGAWLPRSDPSSVEAVRALVRSAFQAASLECARPSPDGSMQWLLTSVTGVVNAGNLVRVWVVMRDISDRRKAEEALRQSEIRYRAIFHRSAVSLWEVDTSELRRERARLKSAGYQDLTEHLKANPQLASRALHLARVVDVNEATLRLFEAKSREELLGPIDLTFDPESLADLLPEALGKAERGSQYDIETTVPSRTGRMLNVIMHFSIPAEGEGLSTTLVSVVDITKRTQAEQEKAWLEEQLRQSQKMESVGRLAGGISHDINNLLTPILGYSELLLDEKAAGKKDAARIILGAAQRIRDLSNKLLAFSRKQHLSKSVADLRAVVRDFQAFLRRAIKDAVEMRVEIPDEIGLVAVDIGQVEQVLMNLAINAQDAMPDGGVLTFAVHDVLLDEEWGRNNPDMSPGPYVALTVSDTGTGMDQATRKRIFEPFFTTKEPGKGTGLGLSTVYGIVKQHSGHIEVDSEPGWGTVFTVYFPRFPGTEDPAHG